MLRRLIRLALTLLLVTTAWTACNKGGSEEGSGTAGEGGEQEATTSSEGEGQTEAASSGNEGAEGQGAAGETVAQAPGMVQVSAEGTRFDPPVPLAQIPPGVWYCPMEPVHYASLQQGDGSCPVCGMTLVQHGMQGGHMMPGTGQGHMMGGTGQGHMMPGMGGQGHMMGGTGQGHMMPGMGTGNE